MNRELRDKWVEELRNPFTRQTTGSFEFNGAYCSLGVLCVSADKPATIGATDNWDFVQSVLTPLSEPVSISYIDKSAEYDIDEDVFLPRNVEFSSKNPVDILWRANDVACWTLPQIADWVEQNIPVED